MHLVGDKTVSWFDIWSVEHFVAGISLGALWLWAGCFRRGDPSERRAYLLGVLATALLWEALEFYIEAGYVWDRATYWMQGIEFIGNRLVTDPLLVLAGALAAWRRPWPVVIAPMFSCAWVFVHVLVFPHCMFLQDQITTWTGKPPHVPSYQEWVKEKLPSPPCPVIR